MTESAARIEAMRRRYPDRANLPLEKLCSDYFDQLGYSRHDCEEILTLLADELALPVGYLRPGDQMAQILEPVHTGSPWRWIAEWTRAADGKAELNDRIRRRLTELGTLEHWPALPTVADVVRAWCGAIPKP